MTKKALKVFAEDYLRLQYHVAQLALQINHPIESRPLEYFQRICQTLEPPERTFFQNYIVIADAINNLLRYAIAEQDKFFKGYFMISASNFLYYIRDTTPKGTRLPADIPIKRIPPAEESAWDGTLANNVFSPLMYYASYIALLKCLSRAFVPCGVDFISLLENERRIMGDALSDLKKIVASKPFMGSMTNPCTGWDMGDVKTYEIADSRTRSIDSWLNSFNLFKQVIPLNVVKFAADLRHGKFDVLEEEGMAK